MLSFSKKGIRTRKIYIKVNGLRMPVLILKPMTVPVNATGVMWIHGGGYVTGMKEMAYMGRAAGVDVRFDVYEGMYRQGALLRITVYSFALQHGILIYFFIWIMQEGIICWKKYMS